MQLNIKELELLIQALDPKPSASLQFVALKGSLLVKLAMELNTQMNPTTKTVDDKAEKPALKEIKK